MGEDGELLDGDGFVSILSFTKSLKNTSCDGQPLESEQEEKVVTQMVLK